MLQSQAVNSMRQHAGIYWYLTDITAQVPTEILQLCCYVSTFQ